MGPDTVTILFVFIMGYLIGFCMGAVFISLVVIAHENEIEEEVD